MKLARTTLLSAAGVILALGLTATQAQDYDRGDTGGAPAAGSDRGGGGPAGGAPAGGAPAGEASKATESKPADKPGKAAGQTEGEEAGKAANDKKAGAEMKDEKAGAEMKDERPGTAAETKDSTDKAATKGKGEATEGKAGAAADTKAGAEGAAEGKAAKVDAQQISKVKTYFSQHKPSVKIVEKSEISVSVGIVLPTVIVLYDLPPDIIVVEGPCTVKYFVWGDEVVLVDSCTREVVEIIVIA